MEIGLVSEDDLFAKMMINVILSTLRIISTFGLIESCRTEDANPLLLITDSTPPWCYCRLNLHSVDEHKKLQP